MATVCCNQNCNQGRNCPLRKKRATSPGSHAPTAVKLARRVEACARILVLLEDGPLSAIAVSDALGLRRATGYAHLRYMASNLRNVRSTGKVDDLGRSTWELGEDPTMPTPDERLDASFAQRQRIVPAKQLGMWRDVLVSALFGPPGQGARA